MEDRDRWYRHFLSVLKNDNVLSCELALQRGDGSRFYAQLDCLRLKKDGDEPVVRIVLTDITGRKQVEKSLRESEERSRLIAETITEVFWMTDVQIEKIYFISPAYERIWGRSLQSLYENPRSFIEAIHPDDLARVLAVFELQKTGTPFDYEYRITKPDGTLRWIWDRGYPIHEPTGEVLRYAGIAQDITERKQAEEESHLILAMGKAIAEAEDFTSALDVSIRAICESAGWNFGEVWIPSHDGTHLELGTPYCCLNEEVRSFRAASEKFEFAPGAGLPGRVWASGKPIWIPDVTVDANFPRAPFAKQVNIKAAAGIPILSGNMVVAVMVFFMRKERPEDERMTAIISAVAAQLGTVFQRKRDAERIQQLANFDVLTGLPNRVLLNDRVSQALSMAQRNRAQLAVMFLDLDHFKNINDTLGHRIGDALLIEVAKRLKSIVREEDTVSRVGGDEFILVLPDTNADGAARVARKVLEVITQPNRIEQHDLAITPSIGIAMYPDDGEHFDALSRCADVAMYRAKHDGRNNYRFFTSEMQTHSARTLQLENALRRALERGQLSLHYQPQMSLPDGRLIGAEALLRWQHPELGMISPAEFIPIAEASGQILQIGEWVLRTAVHQLKRWMDSGMTPMVIAVNLSVVQFHQHNLTELVMQILDEVKLPPQYLELELTEGVAMDDPLGAIALMDSLHERGIHMSIDDFGTGYSSLSYLKRFEIYKLKIDQSFVSDITEDPEDKAIVDAVISLASSLGLQTLAEGVETEGQLAFLREQGCNEAQGYYFSKPLPADQFEVFVRGKRKV